MLTADDLETYIASHGIAARLVRDLVDTSTVPLAAAALGVDPQRIIKSMLLLVELPGQGANPQPVLVICDGTRRVDHRALAAHFGVSRKRVELASAGVVLKTLGYPAGGVPPIGHHTKVPAILDMGLLAQEGGNRATVYGGGGDDSTMLEIQVAELQRVLQPAVLDVTAAPNTPRGEPS